jgi:hypothetical protein
VLVLNYMSRISGLSFSFYIFVSLIFHNFTYMTELIVEGFGFLMLGRCIMASIVELSNVSTPILPPVPRFDSFKIGQQPLKRMFKSKLNAPLLMPSRGKAGIRGILPTKIK